MNLDAPSASKRENQTTPHSESILGDFGSGLGSHLKAPLVGIAQGLSGSAFDDHTLQKPTVPESKSHMAGEMVGDAIVFLGTTAVLKKVAGLSALAPVAAGGVLGLIEPLKNGEDNNQRLVHGATGAATMLLIDKGPAFLAKTGLIASAEKSVAGAIASGALVGAATEQVNVYAREGHLATFGQTATGALGFGLTSGAFQGLGHVLSAKASALAARSRLEDETSLVSTMPLPKFTGFLRQSTPKTEDGWHLVLGSGGSKAALTGAGVVLATRAAKLKIDSIGGVSGGFVPAALAATEMPSHKLLEVAKSTDIATLLTQRPLFKQVIKEHRKLDLLRDGIYDTTPLGDMVHGHMPNQEWPDKLWTMAVGGEHSEVVFSKKGVTEYSQNGSQVILSSKPPKVGDAVRATSAIPGVLASMELYGRRLYDGALGKFGKCPSDMAGKHFGISGDRVIASLPVGAMTMPNKKLYQFAKYLSGNLEKDEETYVEHAGIVVRPEVSSFHSLRFSLQPKQREEAILAGYRAAIQQFAKANLIQGENLTQAVAAGQSMSALELFFAPKPAFPFFNPDILRLTWQKPKGGTGV